MSTSKSIAKLNLLMNAGSYLELSSLNKKTAELNKITKEIGEAQIKLQRQQLDIQTKTLIQQELQTMMMAQQVAQKNRQKELKNTFFYIRKSTDTALSYKETLNKFIYLSLIEKDIVANNLNPNDLEELQDKEYAEQTLIEFRKNKEIIINQLTDNDSKQLDTINEFIEINRNLEEIKARKLKLNTSPYQNIELSRLQDKLIKYKKKFVIHQFVRVLLIFLLLMSIVVYIGLILTPLFLYFTTTKKKISEIEMQIKELSENLTLTNSEFEQIISLEKELVQNQKSLKLQVDLFMEKFPNLEFLILTPNNKHKEQSNAPTQKNNYDLDEEIISLIMQGKKINAIQILMKKNKLSINEAKNLVDTAEKQLAKPF